MVEITIDPVTRIEGHLNIKVNLENSKFTDAWASHALFRGFEEILQGRDPRDAIYIASRMCGVCYTSHGIAAALALDQAMKVKPPPLGTLLRVLTQYAEWLYDHILILFVLEGPDYGPPFGKLEEFAAFKGKAYLEALKISKIAREATAVWGGKMPHQASFVPGGITEFPDVSKFAKFTYRVLEVKRWVDDYMIPLMDKFYDSYKDELIGSGETPANLLSFGVFDDETLDPQNRLLKPGAIINGSLVATNLYDEIAEKIFEHVNHSWYTQESAGEPLETAAPIPQYSGIDKQGKYSWCKAPRWNDEVVEVGPLARMWNTALQNGGKVETDAGNWSPPDKPNTIERLYARGYEVAFVATKVIDKLYELLDLINRGEREVFQPFSIPENSEGYGLTEAARGALGHWVKVENKKIARYQVITPTTWNGSPRDDKGRRGPIEEALANTPVKNEDPTLDAVRVVRAFDPCIACAVHVFDGTKISTRNIEIFGKIVENRE
ncbi:nickel-dependent hydrogenase large subunit [[Eubacterium] cellulosolvens]